MEFCILNVFYLSASDICYLQKQYCYSLPPLLNVCNVFLPWSRDGYNDFNTFYMQVSNATFDAICWTLELTDCASFAGVILIIQVAKLNMSCPLELLLIDG